MRQGKERRVRHDVGAKSKTIVEADRARELVHELDVEKTARLLVDQIIARAPDFCNEALSAVAHEIVRQALIKAGRNPHELSEDSRS